MKSKLTVILVCLAIGIGGAFTSCKDDAPDIYVKTETTQVSDFTGIVNALKDNTQTIEKRLDILNTALNDVNTTLKEKLELIETAVNAGIATYEQMANALIEAVKSMNLTQETKLQMIYDIIQDTGATLYLRLAAIEAAINDGTGSYEKYAQQLIDAIKALDASQADKLQAIHDILDSELATLLLKVELTKAAVEQGFISNKDAIAALQQAIVDQLKANHGNLGKCIDDITAALKEIKNSLDAGFELPQKTIDTLATSLVEYLTDANTAIGDQLTAVENAIQLLNKNLDPESETTLSAKILTLLEEIKEAILKGNDYSELIAAIKALAPEPEPEPEPEPKYEFVDLGLKSGTLWATCNLGAEKPEEFGGYYGYGMTKPYAETDEIDWPKYFEYLGGKGTEKNDCGTDKDPLREYVRPDGMFYYIADYPGIEDGIGRTEWDAAYVTSSKLRLPTNAEFLELLRNTISRWTTENGVNGVRFTSKSDSSKSIFLPAAGYDIVDKVGTYGYYLSSTPKEEDMTYCYQLGFDNDIVYTLEDSRRFGVSIRPVYNAPKL